MDFAAPGVDIYAASFTDLTGINAFDIVTGTSHATPMVTGIASLGMSVRPGMTKDDLVYALKGTAVDLGTPGRDDQFGWGRVNAHDALVILRDLVFFGDFEKGDLSRWSLSLP